MAIDRQAVVDAVQALIEADEVLGSLQVEHFPDEPEDFITKHLKSTRGAVVLSYAGGRKVRGGEYVSNHELFIDAVIVAKRLSGEDSILVYLQRAEAAIERQRITAGDQGFDLDVPSDEFIGEHKRVWQHLVRIRAQLL